MQEWAKGRLTHRGEQFVVQWLDDQQFRETRERLHVLGRSGTHGSSRAHPSVVPVHRLSEAASNALASAHRLVSPQRGQPPVDDDEAVAQLRRVRGGREALQEAAHVIGHYVDNGYPATRMFRLLRAAADEPVPAVTPQEAAVEARQRQLSEQPLSVTFQQLADQVPALLALEQRARTSPNSFLRELSPLQGLLGGPGGRARQLRITLGMRKAVQRLVGPSSGVSDPVVSSIAGVNSVDRYLRHIAGIDPHSWGPSGS